MLFKKDSTTLSLPKICPHPPQLWKLPDGFDNKQLEPVPEIRTIPPALVAVTKGPRVSLHVWHSTVMFECLAIRCDEIVSWFSWLSAPLRDNPRLTNGVSGEMPSESFALVTKSAIRLQHSSSPKTATRRHVHIGKLKRIMKVQKFKTILKSKTKSKTISTEPTIHMVWDHLLST